MDACERREQLLKTVRESERCGRVGKKHACRAQQDRNAQNYEKRVEYSFEINMDEMKINEQCLAFIPKHVHKRGKKNDEQQRFHAAEYDFELLGNANADECADYCIVMFSDLTRKVTMQNLYHDGGFSSMGMSLRAMTQYNKSFDEYRNENGEICYG